MLASEHVESIPAAVRHGKVSERAFLEDKNTRIEVREIATDIMATSTTKLSSPAQFVWLARLRSSFIKNAPRFARRSTRIAFPPCEEPSSLALLNAILIFFQYLLVFTIKPGGGKKKKKVLSGNDALRSTTGSSSEENGDSTSSESSEASEPSGSKVEPS